MKSITALSLLALAGSALAQTDGTFTCSVIQSCGSNAQCLATCTQYTLLGTVVDLVGNSSGPGANYSADISVACDYKGQPSLAGKTITVSGFSNPPLQHTDSCNATIAPGTTDLFFVYVSSPAGAAITYSISTVCYGGIPATPANLLAVSVALGDTGRAGLTGNCTLPTPTPSPSPVAASSTTSSSPSSKPSSSAATLAVPLVSLAFGAAVAVLGLTL
ncbi:uncharacterized protein BJ171DRAFT_509751 [Polychytrium aggregatum]|uniref:uncharacterized protein n=1 Tax=Polychytrium aggregatum TaxID=110093 RepID=UPI0022FE20D8|nr:uncharacterized protein BJ171DRAFT_509751 [Polychytrium aggregatum]KAI9203486.1 hypothetical protein BJ171DRAFT_509751 [Polychytrium aggregatum]